MKAKYVFLALLVGAITLTTQSCKKKVDVAKLVITTPDGSTHELMTGPNSTHIFQYKDTYYALSVNDYSGSSFSFSLAKSVMVTDTTKHEYIMSKQDIKTSALKKGAVGSFGEGGENIGVTFNGVEAMTRNNDNPTGGCTDGSGNVVCCYATEFSVCCTASQDCPSACCKYLPPTPTGPIVMTADLMSLFKKGSVLQIKM